MQSNVVIKEKYELINFCQSFFTAYKHRDSSSHISSLKNVLF